MCTCTPTARHMRTHTTAQSSRYIVFWGVSSFRLFSDNYFCSPGCSFTQTHTEYLLWKNWIWASWAHYPLLWLFKIPLIVYTNLNSGEDDGLCLLKRIPSQLVVYFMNNSHSPYRHRGQRPSLTLTECQQKAAALEPANPAHRSVLHFEVFKLDETLYPDPGILVHSSYVTYVDIHLHMREKSPEQTSAGTRVVVVDFQRYSSIFLKQRASVLFTHITVFTCSVCCGRCLQLFLALSLCIITRLAESAGALIMWDFTKSSVFTV